MRILPADEKGSALVIVSMVMVILTLLGISYLLTAEDESRIAVAERSTSQAQYVAEAGVRLVNAWFNDPSNTGYRVPDTTEVVRTLRWVDDDQDGTYEAYGSATAPYNVTYRNATNDLFEKPYRGNPSFALEGTEDHPDVSIYRDGGNVAMTSFLDAVNDELFPDFPAPSLRARIERIDIYSPPQLDLGGNLIRYGMATVKVTATVVRFPGTGDEKTVATRTTRAVLNEMPYPGPTGPLQSCKSIQATGDFSVHWGTVSAVDNGDFSINLDVKIDSGMPWSDIDNIYSADEDSNGTNDLDDWLNHADQTIEDPWFRIEMGGTLTSYGNGDCVSSNCQVFPMGEDPDWQDPTYSAADIDPDAEHSNVFARVDKELCPVFDYEIWKSIATSGLRNINYFAYDGSSDFLQDGVGSSVAFDVATDDAVGLFFFDTTDGMPPRDDDNDGVFDNLTPAISVNGGAWDTGGFLYLNAQNLATTGLGNVTDRPLRAPGEPYKDLDGDGRYDSDEPFLRVTYPADYTHANADYSHNGEWQSQDDWGGTYTRLDDGPPQNQNIHIFGVLYTNGEWDAKGNAVYFGSVIAKGGVAETGAGAAGTPDIFFDERLLKGGWPPKEIGLPRVYVTEWETQD